MINELKENGLILMWEIETDKLFNDLSKKEQRIIAISLKIGYDTALNSVIRSIKTKKIEN